MTRRSGRATAGATPGGRLGRPARLGLALVVVAAIAGWVRWPDLTRAWWERQSLEALAAAARARPGDSVRAATAARRLLAAERAADALRLLEATPEPRSPELARLYVRALVEAGRLTEAMALTREPDEASPDELYAAALVWSRTGRPKAARTLLEQVVALRPDFPEAWLLLGELSVEADDPAGALRALDRAAAGGEARALGLRSLVHLGAGRVEEAERDAREGLRRGRSPEALAMLGQVLLQSGRPEAQDEALASLEQARAAAPEHPQALTLLAQAYRTRGRHADAVGALRLLLRRRPDNPAPYLLLGQSYLALGRRETAERVFALHRRLQTEWDQLNRLEQQARAAGDRPAPWVRLVEACLRAGDPERARRHLGEALARCGRIPSLEALPARVEAAPPPTVPVLPADAETNPQ